MATHRRMEVFITFERAAPVTPQPHPSAPQPGWSALGSELALRDIQLPFQGTLRAPAEPENGGRR
ncbi:uncharacterized protein THITE_158270 [Thermothielavioides terrestris NRRL 8126]|uniref:Uncharacterized protein n=1 Tax=Thermothielavioides terrestris (strain ATCC 38088 / NRRL 8126) TaxID=578455 RepID=G2QSS4_THETT|nr:uncharacterized protein THITE_158270 [Thermothielavioides terrestris NRRL 8126]AEO64357.1 hypothetical protein THITE_158270 [Thermothielavioides terrestris NRRL 8126]